MTTFFVLGCNAVYLGYFVELDRERTKRTLRNGIIHDQEEADCITLCDSTAICQGFTYFPNRTCSLQNKFGGSSLSSAGSKVWIKCGRKPPPPPLPPSPPPLSPPSPPPPSTGYSSSMIAFSSFLKLNATFCLSLQCSILWLPRGAKQGQTNTVN